jgi:hypothetical protein
VAVTHTFVLAIAMVALLCLPAIVAMIVCADELYARAAAAWSERRAARRQRRALTELDRTIGPLPAEPALTVADDERPTIEQIAADLHRLGNQRLGVATRSQVWQTAVTRAYDEQLGLACHCLGIAEHLAELQGVDREIERLRVEGELQAAGMRLPTADSQRRRREQR